jgi:pimeloyl-ACP methyl ester carboxylesterase
MKAKTQYARNPEGQYVAFQTLGEGEPDIVFIPDWCTNLDVMWEEPTIERFLNRLASMGRLICFDKRGTGVSDPVPMGGLPTFEEMMRDVESVLDAAGSQRAALIGHGDGSPIAILFAATHPARTLALILADAYARRSRAPNYTCGIPPKVAERYIETILKNWGTGQDTIVGAPSLAHDLSFIEWRGRLERLAMSPGVFDVAYPTSYQFDVRPVLETITAPTLVLHRAENRYIRTGNGRFLAEHIDGAKFVELPGGDHFYHAGDIDAFLDPVEAFLAGKGPRAEDDRVLATVVFTDIVNATEHLDRIGDRAWRNLLERHHALVRQEIHRFRGREIDTAGDGFFATFDGPARGVRCAMSIRDAVRSLDLEIRAGVHTGECEVIGDKVSGIAVHIGARVMAMARPNEVLVTRTVKDLVAGSGLVLTDSGVHSLKGVAGKWRLYTATRP